MHEEIFNIAELRANIGEDCITERELLEAFIGSCEEAFAELGALLQQAPSEEASRQWKRRLHDIKGAAMNVCAPTLMQMAQAAHDSNVVDESALRKVKEQFMRVRERVRLLDKP